jgi:hypothetical protein
MQPEPDSLQDIAKYNTPVASFYLPNSEFQEEAIFIFLPFWFTLLIASG